VNYIVICINTGETVFEKFDYYDYDIDYYNENKDQYINVYVTEIIKGG
jgi:hypothetical protein